MEERRRGRFLNESYVAEMGTSMCGPCSSDLTSVASQRPGYRGVLKANSTHTISHFIRATPIFDTPGCLHRRRFNRRHKTQNKHTPGFVQIMEYTEM